VLPFSGGVELYGQQARLGLDLAVKDINAARDSRQACRGDLCGRQDQAGIRRNCRAGVDRKR
jgi:hypothetical protein